MARYYIGAIPGGRNVLRGVRTDIGGRPLLIIESGEVIELEISFSAYLNEGEIIADVRTLSSHEIAIVDDDVQDKSVVLIIQAIKGEGYLRVEVFLSTGLVWNERINVRNPIEYTSPIEKTDDYSPRINKL